MSIPFILERSRYGCEINFPYGHFLARGRFPWCKDAAQRAVVLRQLGHKRTIPGRHSPPGISFYQKEPPPLLRAPPPPPDPEELLVCFFVRVTFRYRKMSLEAVSFKLPDFT